MIRSYHYYQNLLSCQTSAFIRACKSFWIPIPPNTIAQRPKARVSESFWIVPMNSIECTAASWYRRDTRCKWSSNQNRFKPRRISDRFRSSTGNVCSKMRTPWITIGAGDQNNKFSIPKILLNINHKIIILPNHNILPCCSTYSAQVSTVFAP